MTVAYRSQWAVVERTPLEVVADTLEPVDRSVCNSGHTAVVDIAEPKLFRLRTTLRVLRESFSFLSLFVKNIVDGASVLLRQMFKGLLYASIIEESRPRRILRLNRSWVIAWFQKPRMRTYLRSSLIAMSHALHTTNGFYSLQFLDRFLGLRLTRNCSQLFK
jgi:hypothetical protein